MNRRDVIKAGFAGCLGTIGLGAVKTKPVILSKASEHKFGRPDKALIRLIRKCGHPNRGIAFPAQKELATAIAVPMSQSLSNACPNLQVANIKHLMFGKESSNVVQSCEMKLSSCREARWDIMGRMLQEFEREIVKKLKTLVGTEKYFITKDFTLFHDMYLHKLGLVGFYGYMQVYVSEDRYYNQFANSEEVRALDRKYGL